MKPLILAVVPVIVWFLVAARAATEGQAARPLFFQVAATVIPTLILTLAVQVRYFAQAPPPRVRPAHSVRDRLVNWLSAVPTRGYLLIQVAFLGLGEYRALQALALSEKPDVADTSVVAATVAAGFAAIFIAALFPRIQARIAWLGGPECARQELNLRPRAPEARALSPELRALGMPSVPPPSVMLDRKFARAE